MKKNIVLLHGALGAESQLQGLKQLLNEKYNVYTFNFSGHGGKPFSGNFSIELFANELQTFCEANNLSDVHVFGYSMGGYVGLYLALTKPTFIRSVITLGTKLHWDEAIAAKEVSMMQPEKIEQKIPAFADNLKLLHHPNGWKDVMSNTATMLTAMGLQNPIHPEEFKNLQVPVLLMLGDSDKMVGLQETLTVFQQIPNAQLAVLPATPHALEKTDTKVLTLFIDRFVTNL